MDFIQDDDPIQTLPTNGSDQTFAIRILPGRSRCNGYFVDPRALDACPEKVSVDVIGNDRERRDTGTPARNAGTGNAETPGLIIALRSCFLRFGRSTTSSSSRKFDVSMLVVQMNRQTNGKQNGPRP